MMITVIGGTIIYVKQVIEAQRRKQAERESIDWRAESDQKKAELALKVEAARVLTEQKIEQVHTDVKKTEKLVNNQSGVLKRALAIATQKLFDADQSDENRQNMESAKAGLREHEANQAAADQVQAQADAALAVAHAQLAQTQAAS